MNEFLKIRLADKEKKRFKLKCESQNTTMSQAIRRFIDNYIVTSRGKR